MFQALDYGISLGLTKSIMATHLDPQLLEKLSTKLGRKTASIRSSISQFAHKHGISSEAALVITCKQNSIGCAYFLRKQEGYVKTEVSTTLRNISEDDSQPARNRASKTKKITRKTGKSNGPSLIVYDSDNKFVKGHIEEINQAFGSSCYTCVVILMRKVVENMLIDILRFRYPDNTIINKELYFDTNKNRPHDFNVILKNFEEKSTDFDMERKLVTKIIGRARELKESGNDKAHSWFHLVKRPKEIKELDLQELIDLITELEKRIGYK